VRHFAGSAILARYEGVVRYELVVHRAPPPTLHLLRIACKQARYAIELFDGALGKRAQPLDETLVRAQDSLGQLHDAVVAHDEVQRLAEQVPSNTGLATYAVALAAEGESLRTAFDPIWQEFSSQPFHEELASLLGRL
jgi:CHAD domain-containing protein